MRNIIRLIVLFITVLAASLAHAQSANEDRMKAYFFSAQDAFEAKNYDQVLSDLENVEQLNGGSNEHIEALRTKSFYYQGDYTNAQKALDRFYTFNPSNTLIRDMNSYTLDINRKFQAEEEKRKAQETAEREARRLAPFKASENSKKRQLLSQNKFAGLTYLAKGGSNGSRGRRGSQGSTGNGGQIFGCATTPGGVGNYGGNGTGGKSGTDGGKVYVTIVETPMQHTAPFGLVLVKSASGRTLSEGYWDFATPLTIDVSGGNGGNGGAGGKGGRGGAGVNGRRMSNTCTTYGSSGGNGGDGGGGGDGGKGGKGGYADITLVGSQPFYNELKSRLTANVSGGQGGKGGSAGRGGDAGTSGSHAYNGRAPAANRGRSGRRGQSGRKGADGQANFNRKSPTELSTRSVQPQKTSGAPKTKTPIIVNPKASKRSKRDKYLSACEGGKLSSCTYLGYMYQKGLEGHQDDQRAWELYKQACNEGYKEACRGVNFIKGRMDRRAESVLLCEKQVPGTCRVLADLYDRGEGGTRDQVKARTYYNLACNQDDYKACNWLGSMHQHGRGGEKDKAMAANLYHKSCDLGHFSVGCYNLGKYYLENSQGDDRLKKAKKYLTKSCESGFDSACQKLKPLN